MESNLDKEKGEPGGTDRCRDVFGGKGLAASMWSKHVSVGLLRQEEYGVGCSEGGFRCGAL